MTKHELSLWFHGPAGICGCGEPDAVAKLMLDVLGNIQAGHDRYEQTGKYDAAEHKLLFDERQALLPTDGLYYTVYNFYDKLGLIEHGSALPGWLTELGKEVLAALREHGTDGDAWGHNHCTASSDGLCECGAAVPST